MQRSRRPAGVSGMAASSFWIPSAVRPRGAGSSAFEWGITSQGFLSSTHIRTRNLQNELMADSRRSTLARAGALPDGSTAWTNVCTSAGSTSTGFLPDTPKKAYRIDSYVTTATFEPEQASFSRKNPRNARPQSPRGNGSRRAGFARRDRCPQPRCGPPVSGGRRSASCRPHLGCLSAGRKLPCPDWWHRLCWSTRVVAPVSVLPLGTQQARTEGGAGGWSEGSSAYVSWS